MTGGGRNAGYLCLALMPALAFLSGAGEATAPDPAPQRVISSAQAISAATETRLSDMGPDGDEPYDASASSAAYSSTDNQYLVVWSGDDDAGGPATGEHEIRAQFIDGVTGLEVGADDFRVSFMGTDGDPLYDALEPSVAYNKTSDEYLVVWSGDDDSGALADDEFEIYGQRLDATGTAIGAAFRISAMGPDGDTAYHARGTRVVHNDLSNEYLVVWEGVHDAAPLVAGESEIFGQFIDATGQEIGLDDFRISDMGPDGDSSFDAFDPAVAYSVVDHEYLVVWSGDDDSGGLVAGEFEIFGQLIEAATGLEIGADFRISETDVDGQGQFDANEPSVAYNGVDHEYLVVWEADGDPFPDGKFEIRGRRIDADTGLVIETEDFVISAMGDPSDTDLDAQLPSAAYDAFAGAYVVVWEGDDTAGALIDNEIEIYGRMVTVPLVGTQFRVSDMGTDDGNGVFDGRRAQVVNNSVNNDFLVVWDGDDDTGELSNDELEVYGQRIMADGTELGTNDFRISTAGPDGDLQYDARSAAVAYNGINNEYLVVWEGDDNTGTLVAGEMEIFGQRVDAATGAEIGANDFRISDMGPDGDVLYEAGEPRVAWNSADNLYLVVWEGDDDTAPFIDEEFEVWGQLIDGATGAEIGADFRISDVGPDGLDSRDAGPPDVAYDSVSNRFFVVWEADDSDVGTPNHKNEIFGQLLDASTGGEVGVNDFRISDMGPNDDADYDAREAAVAFNAVDNEFLVVWRGEDDAGALIFDEFEIFGQRIDAPTGNELGTNDFRISDMGTDGDVDYDAQSPAVAHNATDNEYLVAWRGDDDTIGLADNENEIYGQRLDGMTGSEIGVNDFRVSDMGPDGDATFDAVEPAVLYNAAANQFLVVWEGNDDGAGLHPLETEIYAQRIDASGSEIGDNDVRVSHTGDDGVSSSKAADPSVAFAGPGNDYMITWNGDDATGAMIDDEQEIHCVTIVGKDCGNGVIDPGENCETCPDDVQCAADEECIAGECEPLCGNGVVDSGEDCETCPQDVQCTAEEECVAGVCTPLCGNGVVDPGEDCETCPQDVQCEADEECLAGVCTPLCGNGVIDPGEDCATCPQDVQCAADEECVAGVCTPLCGNGVIDPGEDCATCPQDVQCAADEECVAGVCKPLCGNGVVDPGENCENCVLDVVCPPGTECVNGNCEPLCGNGVIDPGEDCDTCPQDVQCAVDEECVAGVCSRLCGNGVVDPGEDCATCPADVPCPAGTECVAGNCEPLCGNGVVDPGENCANCPADVICPPGEGCVAGVCEPLCGNGVVDPGEDCATCPADVPCPPGEECVAGVCQPLCGNGVVDPGEDCANCPADVQCGVDEECLAGVCSPLCGNGVIDPGENCENCVFDVVCPPGTECVDGNCELLCGNGVVDQGEDCVNCPADVPCAADEECVAGMCEPLCGNGVVDPGEDCENCPADVQCPPDTECVAGMCERLCGNGVVDPGEDCDNCPGDVVCPQGTECVAGVCTPLCGNGVIDPGETCSTCPIDVPCQPGEVCFLGVCVPLCGNGIPDPGEDCETCPDDVPCPPGEECVAGVCEPLCGNGVVDPGEDCANCPADVQCQPDEECVAGVCQPLCGNGVADPGEDCANCPADIPCPPGEECVGGVCELLCGNGAVDPGEDCANCPADVQCPPDTECVRGMCEDLCGNGVVDPGEDCETCPVDVPCPGGSTCVNGTCDCPWDLNGDDDIGINDLLILLGAWGPFPGHPADFNGDNVVGIEDFLELLAHWGRCV